MIKVEVKGLEELQKNLEASADQMETFFKPALVDSTREIQREAKATVTTFTGELKGSIKSSVRGLRGEVVADAKQGIFIEEGTRPHFPPVAPLERWGLVKLGQPGLGFVIARKIAREGTEAQPFMKPALEKSLDKISMFFSRSADNLVKFITK